MRKFSLGLLCLLLGISLQAQVNYSANDTIVPYTGYFRAGTNLGAYPGFSDEFLAEIAAGNPAIGVDGLSIKTLRPGLFEDFLYHFGYDARLSTYELFDELGLEDNTLIVGFPADVHRDQTEYCPGISSTLFSNMYTDIWDNGENGTPVNDNNHYALYIYRLATMYGEYIKFWEIWNEPGFDFTENRGWLPPGEPGNWWENNPDPCDYKLRAPIFHYVRLLRISYEVIKSVHPESYIAVSGVGYPSFLDAILRNTDNPFDGSSNDDYPLKGGAYFDVMGFHSYPHFDGSLRYWDNELQDFVLTRHSDAAAQGVLTLQDTLQGVLNNYGYDGTTFPEKPWIITEINLPRKQFDDYIGSDEAQRNFMIKNIVVCMQNNFLQSHIFKLAEDDTYENAFFEFDVMGLYEKLDITDGYFQKATDGGISYKTVSELLFGTVHDPERTAALDLPQGIKGGAFKDINDNYTYVLWAETSIDNSEAASGLYSFPEALGIDQLIKREWNFGATGIRTNVSPNNIDLTGAPIFLTDMIFSADVSNGCAPQMVQFNDESPSNAVAWSWTFEGGNPAVSSEQHPNILFENAGTFEVKLESFDTEGNLLAAQTDRIRIEFVPEADFSYTINGALVDFTNSSTSSSTNTTEFLWDFGDGNTSVDPSPNHLFLNSGTYTVNLTASNHCGNTTSTVILEITAPSTSMINYTANDQVNEYEGMFRPGSNTSFYPPWSDEQLGDIAAGNLDQGQSGAGVKSFRTILPQFFLEFWGYEVEKETYEYYNNLDIRDNVVTVGFPSEVVRDTVAHCPEASSILFKNLYLDIWDGGLNGTMVNDENEFARYLFHTVENYKDNIRFWEIISGPDFDASGEKGWLPPGEDGNWWENDPDPCDYALHAPIQYYVRMLRISYEIIKTLDPDAYVTIAGIGFPSFLDAVLRNTDNPIDGSVKTGYERTGGAYFDAIAYNALPHFDGSTIYYDVDIGGFVYERHSDAAADGIVNLKEAFETVLFNYGYDGNTYPEKQWYISSCNIPGKQFDDYIGSRIAQRNFISKAYVNSVKNHILQFHVRELADRESFADASDPFDVMGLYQKLEGLEPYTQTINEQGLAYKTTSDLLFGTTYDAIRTAELALPDSIDGGAFVDGNGNYTYVLWAKTQIDQSEAASAIYSMPASLGLTNLNKKEWDYAETQTNTVVSTENIALSASPIFLSEAVSPLLPPLAQFGSSTQEACPGEMITFQDASIRAENLVWTFEGATPATSTLPNPDVVYNNPGVYEVRLEAINAAGSHEAIYSEYIIINDLPAAGFNYFVDGPWVFFTNASQGADSYLWDFGDNSTDLAFDPEHFYFNNGTYDVTLIAFNACGSDTIVQQVVLDSAPQADFNIIENNDCGPYTVFFQDQSSSTPFEWLWIMEGANPAQSIEENPMAVYELPGTYEVILIVTNEFGSDTTSQTLELDPELIFEYSSILCSDDSIVVNGVVYNIDNMNGTEVLAAGAVNGCDSIVIIDIQNGDSFTHLDANICEGEIYDPGGWALTTAGDYSFTLFDANSLGCDSTITLSLRVDPTYFIEIQDTILQGETYVFGDSTYTETGVYLDQYTTVNGCDSIIQLNLFVDIIDAIYDFSKEINLSYSPNPFGESFVLQFELPESKLVNIDLYDIRGIKIETLQPASILGQGSYTYKFSKPHLAQGVYLLHFQLEDHTMIYRMVHF